MDLKELDTKHKDGDCSNQGVCHIPKKTFLAIRFNSWLCGPLNMRHSVYSAGPTTQVPTWPIDYTL